MKIHMIPIEQIKPYESNPRINDHAVDKVAKSIQEFGWQVPIVLDRKNIILAGHTRHKAALKLGIDTIPCIIAKDLSQAKAKAFRLADNKVAESAQWDFDLLSQELEDLFHLDIDMTEFDFDLDIEITTPEMLESEKAQAKEDYHELLFNIHNMHIARFERRGGYDIPQIEPVYDLPEVKEWIGFNYVMSDKDPTDKGVHFFVDDYQFERIWNRPKDYIDKLRQYKAVLSPDFSPYGDMPLAMQIWNHYRKHWVAAYWQSEGLTVIPTIRSSIDPRSLDFYLEGEPIGGVVAFSSMWADPEDEDYHIFEQEYQGMVETLKPSKILIYGDFKPVMENERDIIELVPTFTDKRWNNG